VHDFKWELRRIVASDRAERVADVPLGLAIERVDVSEPASISMGIAKRYASAIFDLAIEGKSLPKLESDVSALAGALEVSADLRDLISSPVYTRDEQGAAISAVAQKMELTPVMANSLALMASKRRLFVVPQLMAALRAMIAEHKGETTAEVASAKALTKAQQTELAKTLKAAVGKDVNLNLTVDESLIGGLVVKVGSQMIDTSIKARLNALQNTMKEVG